jgi:hypothetical protein
MTQRKDDGHQTISVRMTEEQAEELRLLAHFDGRAIAEEIRDAVGLLVQTRRADPKFRRRVEEIMEYGQRMLAERGHTEAAEALHLPSHDDK